MKYSIRQYVINEFGMKVVKIVTINGELGSGFCDKNNREIFEGDIVCDEEGTTYTIFYDNGSFYLDYCNSEGIPLSKLKMNLFEIVGHSED